MTSIFIVYPPQTYIICLVKSYFIYKTSAFKVWGDSQLTKCLQAKGTELDLQCPHTHKKKKNRGDRV